MQKRLPQVCVIDVNERDLDIASARITVAEFRHEFEAARAAANDNNPEGFVSYHGASMPAVLRNIARMRALY
jgi:hypothetical protein